MIDVPVSDLISKDLRRWFKEKWVDVSRKDKDGKHPPCGRGEAKTDSKGYPKCRPSKKVSSKTPTTTRGISSKEKKAMTRRKRSKPQGVGGKPTVVKSMDADPRDDLLRRKLLELFMNRMKETHERTGDGSGWDSYISKVLLATPSELLTILEAFERHPYEELRAMAAPIRQEYDALSQDYVDMIHDDDGDFTASADPFEAAWDSISKGRFRGYTRSNISNRPYRQAEHRVWDISRKVKRERTKRRYARNKSRGTVRPAMRRQLGAGGKRASTKR